MTTARKIGGEFQIDISQLAGEEHETDGLFYQSGRDALRAILRAERAAGRKDLWLPEFLCGSIINAALREGFTPRYFQVTKDLLISPDAISLVSQTEDAIVLLIDYFGMLDLTLSVELIRNNSNAVVIVDKVQALFEERDFGADYCFSGYRKFLPVPEGAFVQPCFRTIPHPERTGAACYLKTLGGLIKGLSNTVSLPDSRYLDILKAGEHMLDLEAGLAGMSSLGATLLKNTDVESAKRQRVANAQLLQDGLDKLGLTPFLSLHYGSAPLAIPVTIEKRDEIRAMLMETGIYLPVHWPDSTGGKVSQYLMDHELSFIVDQRYDQNDIQCILDELEHLHVRNSKYAP